MLFAEGMNARRHAALLGVDPDRGRRERKNNIVNARANAREERLNHRRRVESDDPSQNLLFAQDSNVGGAVRSLEDLSGNVWRNHYLKNYMLYMLLLRSC